MDQKLKKAIDNNNGIYETVCDSWNIPWQKDETAWWSGAQVPPFYSNLVTRAGDWQPGEVFKAIDDAHNGKWSMKDSFGVLDMALHGMEKLFDAEWFYLESENFILSDARIGLKYRVLTDETELSEWFQAWDRENAALGKMIFHSELVRDPRIHFIAGYRGAEMVVACLLNESDDVMGLSNFFPPQDDPVAYWSEMLGFIEETYGPIDIVGYERRELMGKLKSLGVESVGNLAVWVKA